VNKEKRAKIIKKQINRKIDVETKTTKKHPIITDETLKRINQMHGYSHDLG
jgi:hypothetical protein